MPHADPIASQAYNREYKRRNRWRYRTRQKVYDAAKHANQRASHYGAPGTITADEAADVLSAERCYHCGSTSSLPWWTIDHLEPLHAGGPNQPSNLVCCCQWCNASKMRGDRPGRWSRDHDECVDCGGRSHKHAGHGLCRRCYGRLTKKKRRYGIPYPWEAPPGLTRHRTTPLETSD